MDGRLMIATDDEVYGPVHPNWEYIDHFVNEWLLWDGDPDTGFTCDTLDAVWHMGLAAKGFLKMKPDESETVFLPQGEERQANPVVSFMRG
jgi:hypothetical protein